MMNKQYKVEEVADIIGKTPYTTREYLKAGKIKGYKLGQDWRVDEDDLKQYLEDLRNGAVK